jgi:hypothetical protein
MVTRLISSFFDTYGCGEAGAVSNGVGAKANVDNSGSGGIIASHAVEAESLQLEFSVITFIGQKENGQPWDYLKTYDKPRLTRPLKQVKAARL